MSIPASALRKLATLNLSPEQMAAVLDILADHAEADESRREAQAERKRRQRAASRDSHGTVTGQGRDKVRDKVRDSLPPEGFSPTPPLPNPPSSIPPSPLRGSSPKPTGSSPDGFEDFWTIYPNKVAKAAAVKAWPRARDRASLAEIMAGLRRYVAKIDDRPWCNPATFLNEGRWDDEPATVIPMARGSPSHRPNPLSDAFGQIDLAQRARHERPDDTPPAQAHVRYLPAPSRGR